MVKECFTAERLILGLICFRSIEDLRGKDELGEGLAGPLLSKEND